MLKLGLRPVLAAVNPLTPGSPGSDLNPVIRTDCMYSVKCAEAVWNYKSGRHSALQITCIFFISFSYSMFDYATEKDAYMDDQASSRY